MPKHVTTETRLTHLPWFILHKWSYMDNILMNWWDLPSLAEKKTYCPFDQISCLKYKHAQSLSQVVDQVKPMSHKLFLLHCHLNWCIVLASDQSDKVMCYSLIDSLSQNVSVEFSFDLLLVHGWWVNSLIMTIGQIKVEMGNFLSPCCLQRLH